MEKEFLYSSIYHSERGNSGQKNSEVQEMPPLILSPRFLPSGERPRERLIDSGPAALSDRELLSIILVSGIPGRNVTILAGDLLEYLDRVKAIPPVDDLCGLMGMGRAKACTIAAMLEFGRRKWASGQRIRTPRDSFEILRHFADRRQEHFICISLNGAHEVLNARIVTIGLVNRTIIHPREVFSDPLQDRASAIIVAHNHPSGEVIPSMEDNEITQRLNNASEILGLHLLDHLIFTETIWFSYRQAGKL